MTKARDIASAAPAPSTVSATEIGYLDGVTSAIQTQIDGKASTTADIPKSLIDAKGDLIVGSADNTAARLAVGTNGYTLVADSAETTGLKWAAASGGGMTQITTGTLSGASVALTSFTGYKDLQLVIRNFYGNTATKHLRISLNNNTTGSNYFYSSFGDSSYTYNDNQGAFMCNDGTTLNGTFTNTTGNNLIMNIYDYEQSSGFKSVDGLGSYEKAYNSNFNFRGIFESNSSISTIEIFPSGGSLSGGTYILYGVK